jgi:hypothetical protein
VHGYPPGSVTSPVLVVPFTLWGRHRPRRAGVPRPRRPRDLAWGPGLAGAATAVSHTVARRLTGAAPALPR